MFHARLHGPKKILSLARQREKFYLRDFSSSAYEQISNFSADESNFSQAVLNFLLTAKNARSLFAKYSISTILISILSITRRVHSQFIPILSFVHVLSY